MRLITIFICISYCIFSIDISVFSENEIKSNSEILSFKLISEPLDANYELNKTNINSLKFLPKTAGNYIVEYVDIDGNAIQTNFNVKGKTYEIDEVFRSLKSSDIYETIKNMYMNTENPIETQRYIYENLITLSKEKESIDKVLNIYRATNLFFKNFRFEKKEFLEKIYEIKENSGDLRGEVLVLQELKQYDSKYILLHGEKALLSGIDVFEGLEDLKKLVDDSLNGKAAVLLGDYYSDKNPEQAKKYYFLGDKKKFFMYLLTMGLFNDYELYYNQLSSSEQSEIDEVKRDFDKEKMIDLFLKKANLNMDEGRYELSKEYYEKVLNQSSDKEKIKNSLFNLGKINIIEEKYDKALEIFQSYVETYKSIEEVEALYYLGLCNFKLKNFEKSDIIFNQIKKTYKYSIWDEKIKILLKEI